jgi:hypothetical protein
MWTKGLLALMATVLAANGVHMLFAPEHWYHSLESVPHTGPFNAHFVRDIGCANLASALGLLLATLRTQWLVPGTLTALAFVGPHAGVHLWELATGHHSAAHTGLVDVFGIYGPPLAVAIALMLAPRRLRVAEV